MPPLSTRDKYGGLHWGTVVRNEHRTLGEKVLTGEKFQCRETGAREARPTPELRSRIATSHTGETLTPTEAVGVSRYKLRNYAVSGKSFSLDRVILPTGSIRSTRVSPAQARARAGSRLHLRGGAYRQSADRTVCAKYATPEYDGKSACPNLDRCVSVDANRFARLDDIGRTTL